MRFDDAFASATFSCCRQFTITPIRLLSSLPMRRRRYFTRIITSSLSCAAQRAGGFHAQHARNIIHRLNMRAARNTRTCAFDARLMRSYAAAPYACALRDVIKYHIMLRQRDAVRAFTVRLLFAIAFSPYVAADRVHHSAAAAPRLSRYLHADAATPRRYAILMPMFSPLIF